MLSIVALAALATVTCRVEDAHYTLRTAPQITAWFKDVDSGRDWSSQVAFVVHMGATKRTYWFLPWNGGTDGLQNMASTTDIDAPGWRPPSPDDGPRPLGDFEYIGTGADYTVIDDTPQRGDVAPAHILMPSLGGALWHQYPVLQPRDGAPKQFFDLTSCKTAP